MKITATVKKITYHEIDIDTDDYTHDTSSIKEAFDVYQNVKDDPMSYVDDELGDTRGQQVETSIQTIDIEASK